MNADRSLLSEADREDVQALVLFGTKSPLLRYHFFRIDSAGGARRFIGALLAPGPLCVNTAGSAQTSGERRHLVYLALTFAGLRALGLRETTLASFPEEFREGARRRAIDIIGDVSEESTQSWILSDEAAHLAVLLYSREAASLSTRSAQLSGLAAANGCTLIQSLDGEALPDFDHPSGQRVTHGAHFGFSDGISQPVLAGERPDRMKARTGAKGEAADEKPDRFDVKPGAFVLGHGDPASAETNHPTTNPPELGYNGTFGAFRMFEQDCDAFEEFLDRHAATGACRELLAARMCGRWRNGISLTVSPDSPHPAAAVPPDKRNDFDYAPTAAHPDAVDDRLGLRCPIGSHTRRSNPRAGDIFGRMGGRIRLIRRGMPYGPPHVRGDGKSRGMLGLFLCGSLKHQFEFIMRHWLNDGLFARRLSPSQKDPIVGAGNGNGTFSYRTGAGEATVEGMPAFVSTRAAAYLFFPGVNALRLLSGQADQMFPTASRAGGPPLPDDEDPEDKHIAFVVAAIRDRVGSGTHRDAHPKHHGIVKASFEVTGLDGLRGEDRQRRERVLHGLFAEPRNYRAYIRFSNGNPDPRMSDHEPDLRGMAVKLFDVPGEKLIDDESRTHDFILASDHRFFVPNVKQYPKFMTMPNPEEKLRMFPLLGEVFRIHGNPLAIRYFSQTPYGCGPEVVKYCVAPESLAEDRGTLTREDVEGQPPDFLRRVMAETLARREVIMQFLVQLAPPDADPDNASAAWDTPFTRVATVRIPPQEFQSEPQMALAENISFNPWHAIAEHRPLGSINLTRKHVYLEIARLRRANGQVQFGEPTGHEL